MEAKCNYCDFFGEKYHCNNCKIINGARKYEPQEITCSLAELIEYIERNDLVSIEEKFKVGDFIYIEAYNGEKHKVVILDYGKDDIAGLNTNQAKVTFGVFDIDGYFPMNYQNTNIGGYANSFGRILADRFYRILPCELREHILSVVKKTSEGSGGKNIFYTEDKVWMFSEIEVAGAVMYSVQGEGEQYEFFEAQNNRRVLEKGTWLRSPCGLSKEEFITIDRRSNPDIRYASQPGGIAFGFCVGINK